MTRRGLSVAAAAALVLVLLQGGSAGALPAYPVPGSATQVAQLVGTSASIQRLPNTTLPSIFQANSDDSASYYPVTKSGCVGINTCVFGNLRSKHVVVLFGDSHALMWLPAMVQIAKWRNLKVVMLWKSACPDANVTTWLTQTKSIYVACNEFRAASIKAIQKLAPSLVVMSNRTTNIPGPNNQPISDPAWTVGLEHTIAQLQTRRTRVVVIGDITMFSVLLPDCIAAYPTHVQQCSTPDPNVKIPDHFAAEVAAAKARRVPYINPHPWLCTSVCSPVIGNMIAYFDNNHISATYSAYLATVLLAALRPELPA